MISSQFAAKHTSFKQGLRVHWHSCFDGSGGRGWTERSEGSPGVSGLRPPTPATHQSIADRALVPVAKRHRLNINLSFELNSCKCSKSCWLPIGLKLPFEFFEAHLNWGFGRWRFIRTKSGTRCIGLRRTKRIALARRASRFGRIWTFRRSSHGRNRLNWMPSSIRVTHSSESVPAFWMPSNGCNLAVISGTTFPKRLSSTSSHYEDIASPCSQSQRISPRITSGRDQSTFSPGNSLTASFVVVEQRPVNFACVHQRSNAVHAIGDWDVRENSATISLAKRVSVYVYSSPAHTRPELLRVSLSDGFSEVFMLFPAEIHAATKPNAGRSRLLLQRCVIWLGMLSVGLVWSSTASASCGNYLYRNGKPVTDSSFSMNDHSESQASGKTPAGMPVPPCHGPNCSGNPIPLAPVPAAPTNLIRGFDQAAILESLADWTPHSRAIEVPESERGARFVPSSIFRPPAA